MPAVRATTIRLENFRKVYFYTGKHLAAAPTEHVHAYKPAEKLQIWNNETITNKAEPYLEEEQSVSSLERYLWVGYALPRKSTTNVHHGGKVNWKGEGLQAVAKVDDNGNLIFYVLAPVKKGGLYAKMPLLVAPDKIFFFPRFRDESTNATLRKDHWTATCKRAALRMKRHFNSQRQNAAENHSSDPDSQQAFTDPIQSLTADPAVIQNEPEEGASYQEPIVLSNSERSLVDPLQADKNRDRPHRRPGYGQALQDAFNEADRDWINEVIAENRMQVEQEPQIKDGLPTTDKLGDLSLLDKGEDIGDFSDLELEDVEVEALYFAEPSSRESSVEVDVDMEDLFESCEEDGSEDSDSDCSSGREPSPGTSSFWTCHLCKTDDVDSVKLEPKLDPEEDNVKPKFEKDDIKPESLGTASELFDLKVKDEVKLDLEEKKPKSDLKIHPFFELKPDTNRDPRRQKSSSTPSSAPGSATAFENELLKSPTDTEWKTIEQKTDSLKVAFGLTFEPLDILLVQRFLTMRKISFSEETVRDLTHLLHHKLYGFQPPKTPNAKVKLIKGVIEDMVVLHYGRCLDRGKMGVDKKEESVDEDKSEIRRSIVLG